MKTLESIQKIYKAFQIFAKIAMVLSFIWVGTILTGLLCGIAWSTGVSIMGISVENVLELMQSAGLEQMFGVLLADFVFALTDSLLFFFTHRYLKQELADGTPFTVSGALQVKNLGIKTIVMPLVAVIISAVIYECFNLTHPGDWGNGTTVLLGIALILFALVLRYGAELWEEKKNCEENTKSK